MDHGFILQTSQRTHAGRPQILLYGRLSSGETFLVRDDRETPRFYVAATDAVRCRQLGATALAPADATSFIGQPLLTVSAPWPRDLDALRDRFAAAGVTTFEADLRLTSRYLIDKGLRGAVAIIGPRTSDSARGGASDSGRGGASAAGVGVDVVFDNPELRPATVTTALTTLAFDIETDPSSGRVLAASLYGAGCDEVLLCSSPADCPPTATACANEHALLEAFAARVRAADPDILTGWNIVDFDLPMLERAAARSGARFELGRGPGPLRITPPLSTFWGTGRAQVPGRVILDGLHLTRGAFVELEEYSLDFVASEVLGEGKTLAKTGTSKLAELERMFAHDREAFVFYCRADARLALGIVDKLELVPLAIQRSLLTGMPLDRISASVASFDFLYLAELHRRGIAGPTLARGEQAVESTAGGLVLEPTPGLYDDVFVFDFRSLYPSLIRTFNLDPLAFVPSPAAGEDLIVAPSGAAFRRAPGVLPGMLDQLFPEREQAKRDGNALKSQAIKILMNSFYGVLGTPSCRFHDARIANAVTSFGREILLWTKARCEALGHEVLYGDTDSLFVRARNGADAKAEGHALAARLNTDLAAHLAATWRVESKLALQFETLYRRLFLQPLRQGEGGARKRYAGLVERAGKREVEFTGLEVVRRDWTLLAKDVQRELYRRLFDDLPVDAYLASVAAELRAGAHDGRLVYKKALRKPLAAYVANTPPHVQAARKMTSPPGRVVSYVMTSAGPEPADEQKHPFDYGHYVDKQLRPIAEPVLAWLGLDFRRVIGDERQLSLF